jgi:hypothetical protein
MLRQILEALGSSPLRLLTAPESADAPFSGVVMYESRAPLPPAGDAMLFAIGVRPADAAASGLLRDAVTAGYGCLVIKGYGDELGQLAATADQAGICLLSADEDIGWLHLEALVSTAARTGHAAEQTAVGDLFALANAIAAMVGGATAIEDLRQRILAYSTLPGQPIDDERGQGILGLQVPYVPSNDVQYRELHGSSRVHRYPGNVGNLPRLAVGVRAGGEPLGTIWVVDPAGDLGPDAEQALARAAEIAALHLLAARTSADVARRGRADMIRRLFADAASAGIIAPQLGLSTDVPVAVAAFVVAPADGGTAAQAAARLTDLVSVHCEAHFGQHGCALIEGTVYALLPAHPARAAAAAANRVLVADIAQRAQHALRVPVRASLGTQVAGPHLAARSRQDADLVLKVLAGRPAAEPSFATIDDVRASATLLEIADVLAGVSRFGRGVGPAIRGYDAEHGTCYAQTLHGYLAAGGDIAAAARQLNVHPNTCRYRIARAEELFEFSLADADERLLLWLQLRLASDR